MMVPYVVGMKPRDFVAIPSLDGASYIEDWEIESVSYSQDANGLIRIGVQAWRPFTGMDNLVGCSNVGYGHWCGFDKRDTRRLVKVVLEWRKKLSSLSSEVLALYINLFAPGKRARNNAKY